jgi:ABC-2 type transport system ATP-binding protein
MRDIEELCPRVIIINRGEKIYDGSLDEVRLMGGGRRLIRLSFSREVDRNGLERYGTVVNHDGQSAGLEISGEARNTAAALLEHLPVLDIGIEDVPIEKSIALLFSGKDA